MTAVAEKRVLYYLWIGVLVAFALYFLNYFLSSRDLSGFFLFIVTALSLSLGGLAFEKEPRNPVNLSFSSLVTGIAAWAFGIMMVYISKRPSDILFWIKCVYFGAILIPASLLWFSFVFPSKRPGFKGFMPILIALPCMSLLALLPGDLIVSQATVKPWKQQLIYGQAYLLYIIYLLMFLATALRNLFLSYTVSKGIEKMRVRYLFWGAVFSAPFALLTNLILPIFGVSSLNKFGPLSILVFIAFVTYSIVKHRLMNVEVVIKKGVVFAVVTLFISTVYIMTVLFTENILAAFTGSRSALNTLIVTFILAATYMPVYLFIKNTVDRSFFKNTFEYQEKFRKQTRKLASALRYEDLLSMMSGSLLSVMKVTCFSFMIRDKDKGSFENMPVYILGASSGKCVPLQPEKLRDTLDYLSKIKKTIVKNELKANELRGLAPEIESSFASVWVPVISKERMYGVLALGEKESGDMFTKEDIELLESMADQVALVMNNIELYEEVLSMKNYNESIVRNLRSAVLTFDSGGDMISANDSAKAMFLMPDKKKQNYSGIFEGYPEVSDVLKRSFEKRVPVLSEDLTLEKHGEELNFNISVMVLKEPGREALTFVMVVNDLTEIKRLERMLARSEKLSAVGTMAAGMAHEIKNPLSTIKVMTQLFPLKSSDPEFVQKFNKMMPEQVERIDRIINSTLGFVKAGKPKFEDIDINTVIEASLKPLEHLFKDGRVMLSFAAGDVPMISGDKGQLIQVLQNFIQNAVQAIEGQGAIKIVTKKSRHVPENDKVQIVISDTGKGIPEDNLRKIFDPFFTSKEQGTGLGLSIVHSIIEAHQGHIHVQSKVGKGTTFIITLPEKQAMLGTKHPVKPVQPDLFSR